MKLPFNYILTKAPKKITAIHSDYKKSIEYAFTLEGFGELYQFTNNIDMPYERDFSFSRFVAEFENRMLFDDLLSMLDKLSSFHDKGQLGKAANLVEATKVAISKGIDMDTLYRVMACHYFTLEEPLLEYDYDYNIKKIEAFKKAGHQKLSFFLTTAKSGLLKRLDISAKDLSTFSKLTEAKSQYLTSLFSGKDMRSQQAKEG